jgi:hypothetical protein
VRSILRSATPLLLVVAACTGLRSTPATRYEGIVLNARTLGAERVDDAIRANAAVREYVERNGRPDYIYEGGPGDLEIVYYETSRVAHFHTDPATGATQVGELTPLPTSLVNVLPSDIRAGTPAPLGVEDPEPLPVQCWTVPVAAVECRTCCKTGTACSTACR